MGTGLYCAVADFITIWRNFRLAMEDMYSRSRQKIKDRGVECAGLCMNVKLQHYIQQKSRNGHDMEELSSHPVSCLD